MHNSFHLNSVRDCSSIIIRSPAPPPGVKILPEDNIIPRAFTHGPLCNSRFNDSYKYFARVKCYKLPHPLADDRKQSVG